MLLDTGVSPRGRGGAVQKNSIIESGWRLGVMRVRPIKRWMVAMHALLDALCRTACDPKIATNQQGWTPIALPVPTDRIRVEPIDSYWILLLLVEEWGVWEVRESGWETKDLCGRKSGRK